MKDYYAQQAKPRASGKQIKARTINEACEKVREEIDFGFFATNHDVTVWEWIPRKNEWEHVASMMISKMPEE